jgi:ribosomal protein L12E/L44/L45/RPP1/RPP2
MSEEIDFNRLVTVCTQMADTFDTMLEVAEDELVVATGAMDERQLEETLDAFRVARTAADAALGAYARKAGRRAREEAAAQQPQPQFQQYEQSHYQPPYATGRQPAAAPPRPGQQPLPQPGVQYQHSQYVNR